MDYPALPKKEPSPEPSGDEEEDDSGVFEPAEPSHHPTDEEQDDGWGVESWKSSADYNWRSGNDWWSWYWDWRPSKGFYGKGKTKKGKSKGKGETKSKVKQNAWGKSYLKPVDNDGFTRTQRKNKSRKTC